MTASQAPNPGKPHILLLTWVRAGDCACVSINVPKIYLSYVATHLNPQDKKNRRIEIVFQLEIENLDFMRVL